MMPCRCGANCVSPLHTCGQRLTPNWMLSSAVPDLGLAMVDKNATMGLNLLLQDPLHSQHSLWSTCGVHIVKECEKKLSIMQSDACCNQRSMQTEAEEQRHEGVTLLSPLTLWDHFGVAQLVVPEVP